jgi:hypothetical protein
MPHWNGILSAESMFMRSFAIIRIYSQSILNLLTFLTTPENLDYYPLSMHASRFTFAFTYRYSFTGGGYADGVLTTQ